MATIKKLLKDKTPSVLRLKEKILDSDYIKLKTKNINIENSNFYKEFTYFAVCLDDFKSQNNCTEKKCASKLNGFWNDFHIKDNIVYKTLRPCPCLEREKGNWAKLNNISLDTFKPEYQNTSFDDIETKTRTLVAASKYLKKYISEYPEYKKPVLLIGPPKSGKTLILSVVANEIFEKTDNIVYVNMENNLEELNTDNPLYFKVMKNRYINSSALFIDNLGKEDNTGFARDFFLFEIIKKRIKDKKPTFISTEYSLTKLKEMYSKNNKKEEAKMLTEIIKNEFFPLVLEKYKNE